MPGTSGQVPPPPATVGTGTAPQAAGGLSRAELAAGLADAQHTMHDAVASLLLLVFGLVVAFSRTTTATEHDRAAAVISHVPHLVASALVDAAAGDPLEQVRALTAGRGADYTFEAVGRPPALRHLWSLAIEGQFYVLWPLLLATVGSGAAAFVEPQVASVAAGFTIIWALAWRRPDVRRAARSTSMLPALPQADASAPAELASPHG